MGKLLKLMMLVISAFVLIFIIIGAVNGISNIANGSHPPKQSSSIKADKVNYNKIRVGDAKTGQGGMSVAEVEKILGQPTTQTDSNSGNAQMKVLTFATNAGPNSILITFINDHAAAKTQTGL